MNTIKENTLYDIDRIYFLEGMINTAKNINVRFKKNIFFDFEKVKNKVEYEKKYLILAIKYLANTNMPNFRYLEFMEVFVSKIKELEAIEKEAFMFSIGIGKKEDEEISLKDIALNKKDCIRIIKYHII